MFHIILMIVIAVVMLFLVYCGVLELFYYILSIKQNKRSIWGRFTDFVQMIAMILLPVYILYQIYKKVTI